jgi:transposase-like protein
MYACFAAAAGWLLARLAVRSGAPRPRVRRSRPKRDDGAPNSLPARLQWAFAATPTGYGIGMLGLGVAFFGLGGDIIWHTVFGVEGGIARVIAPFHLFLFTGAGLLLTSPLRSTWNSPDYEGQLTLRRALPPILAMTLIISLSVFLFQWMTAFMDWKPSTVVTSLPASVAHNEGLIEALQMVLLARILLTGMTLVGVMLLGIRRFRFPFGAFTIAFTIPPLFDQALRNLSQVGIVFAAMATGLVADTLIKVLKPTAERTGACRAVALFTSFTFAATFLIVTGSVYGEKLPFDLTIGTIGITGVVGLALSAIAIPPGSKRLLQAEESARAEAVAVPSEPAVVADAEPVVVEAPAPVEPAKPRVLDPAALKVAARIVGQTASKENPIEAVALLSMLRGMPTREVGASFEPKLSGAELGQLCHSVAKRHREWSEMDLDEVEVVYLFLEAISLPAPSDPTAEHDLLGAWGIDRHGKRVLLGLRTGSRDRATAWGALGADLVERGMHTPALVVADGAPGVWRVIQELWPDAVMQQSVSSALTEACEGLDADKRKDLRSRFGEILESARSADAACERLEALLDEYREEAPARMAVLGHRLERLTAHLAFPKEHRRRTRSAGMLERAFGWLASEQPVEDLPAGATAVALVWAVLDMGVENARRLPMSLHATDQLEQLRRRGPVQTPEHSSAN